MPRTWHVLDNGVAPTEGTLLCVHGNPTWSYLWRRFLASAEPGWRVVAVDQLGMGYSERPIARAPWPNGSTTSTPSPQPWASPAGSSSRRTTGADRSRSAGPSAISDRVAGVILANTGVSLPAEGPAAVPDPTGPQSPASRRGRASVRRPSYAAPRWLTRPPLSPGYVPRSAHRTPRLSAARRSGISWPISR